jgi:hypothetical protein
MRRAVFLPMPGSFENSDTASSISLDEKIITQYSRAATLQKYWIFYRSKGLNGRKKLMEIKLKLNFGISGNQINFTVHFKQLNTFNMKKTILLAATLLAGGITAQAQFKLVNGYDLKFDAAKDTCYKYGAGDAQKGFYYGTNSLDDRMFAQRFDFNGFTDSITVAGVIGIFKGYASATSSKSIDLKVWSGTRKDYPAALKPSAGPWKYMAPNADLATIPIVYLSGLKLTTGRDTSFRLLSTPVGVPLARATKVPTDGSFFVGYDMISSLPYATHLDSIGLVSTISSSFVPYVYDTIKRDTVSKTPLTIKFTIDSLINSPSLIFNQGNKVWQSSYLYKNKMVDFRIAPIFSKISTSAGSVSTANLSFFGNYPNPASNMTNIKFGLKEAADVSIRVFDQTGRMINMIELPKQTTGTHEYQLDLSSYAAGNYVYTVSTQEASMGAVFSIVK